MMAFDKTIPPLALIFAASTAACAPVRARPAPAPTSLPLAAPTTSCPADFAGRTELGFREVEWIGRAGDRTWLVAKNAEHRALFRLVSGKLIPVDLPDAFDDGFVSAYAREHFIWIVRTGPGKNISGPAWVLVDVRDAQEPAIGRIESLAPLPVEDEHQLALWTDRALFHIDSASDLVLWNLDIGKTMGPHLHLDAKETEKPWLHCGPSACISIMPEGSEATRRMVMRRMTRDGKDERVEVGPGVVAESMSVLATDRVISAWSRFDDKGLWARKIDAKTGEFDGEPYTMGGVDKDLQDPQAFAARGGTLVAWQAARIGWRLGKLSEDGATVDDIVNLPAEGAFLSVATTDDGIVASVFSVGQNEDRSTEWYSNAQALFVPFGQTPQATDVTTLLKDEHGEGRGGYRGYAIASPNSAAVIVAPHGDAPKNAFMKVLRNPCK